MVMSQNLTTLSSELVEDRNMVILTEYESNTFRGNLGLPYPENRYSL